MISRLVTRTFTTALLLLALTVSSARAGNVVTVNDFNGPPAGYGPWSNLVFAPDGYFYGTTWEGGAYGGGTFFRMGPNGGVTSLHDFNPALEGKNPTDAIHLGADGFFYAITAAGGPGAVCDFVTRTSCGTLVRLDAQGGLTVLHVFDQMLGSRGAMPTGGVIEGPDGALYGATQKGAAGGGLLYRYDPSTMAYSVLHAFDSVQGVSASGPLSVGDDGRLWGTCSFARSSGLDAGLVFAIDMAGNYQPIHYFNPTAGEGRNPTQGVVQANDGFFYGTTSKSSNDAGWGTLFRMDALGQLTTLRVFQGADDGYQPDSPLLLASDGSLYGMTDPGFDNFSLTVKATVFRVAPNGVYSVVGRLAAANGIFPHGGVVEGPGGDLYGTAWQGGAYGMGSVFRLTPRMQVESVVVNPNSIVGGDTSTGTVTLSQPASAGGIIVPLASSQTTLSVPASVFVPAGSRTASFTVATSLVAVSTNVTVAAMADGIWKSTSVTLLPMPVLTAFTASPNPVVGQDMMTGTVTLSGPAPRAGAVVAFTSSNAKQLPVVISVKVPGGMTTASFTTIAAYASRSVQVTLKAVYAGRTIPAVVTVVPAPKLASFTVSPTTVRGGAIVTGTVKLSGPAPLRGATIGLKARTNGVVVLPFGAFVPGGATSASFTIQTLPVTSKKTVYIDATFSGVKKTAMLIVTK